MENSVKIVKLSEVIALTRLSKTSIYERVKDGLITPPFSLGGRSAGYSNKEIQALVKSFIAKRKQVANDLLASLAA